MTELASRVGEVIEASTADFTAQCYELYEIPPLGSLVKIGDSAGDIYGVVCHASTAGIEPGRRPIARGKHEPSEAEIYRSSPQLLKLLKSDFGSLVVGHRHEERLFHFLPPRPARIHSFVYLCSPAEVREFSQSFEFLNILLNARVPVATEELVAAALRQMSRSYSDARAFLMAAGKELAVLLSSDFGQLKAILGRIKE